MTYSNIVPFANILFNPFFYGRTPPTNNRPYSSGKEVVKIPQMWHRNVQPGIVQSSNQIIARDRHESNDITAHEIPNLFYYSKVRGVAIEWWIWPAAPTMQQFVSCKSFEAAIFVFRIVTSLWRTSACQISKRHEHFNARYRAFGTLRDLTIRHLIGYCTSC